MKKGKKYSDSLKLIDRTKQYDPEEAIALVKQTAKGFAKYKDTEKLKNLDNDELGEVASQSGITDITDAFDTLVIGVRFHNVSRLRYVGMPISN